eukprot:5624210-Prymnesium_polylepis.1
MLGLLGADLIGKDISNIDCAAAAGKRMQAQAKEVRKAEGRMVKAANDKARAALKAEDAVEARALAAVSATVEMLIEITEHRAKEVSPWPPEELNQPVHRLALLPTPVPASVPTPVPAPAPTAVPSAREERALARAGHFDRNYGADAHCHAQLAMTWATQTPRTMQHPRP